MIVKTQKILGGKRNRRDYGRLHFLKSGKKVYLAKRVRDEIFRCGAPNVSEAIRLGIAEWAIDDETILQLRNQVVDFVGVCDNTSGDVYLTTLADWMDRSKFQWRNYESKNGARQRYMKLSLFRKTPNMTHLITTKLDKFMKAKGCFI